VELPPGIDYAWFACDADGNVARFTNAGIGPIPVAVLNHRKDAERAEGLARSLPRIGQCELLVTLPDSTDFTDIASRGVFAFDWQDAHRTSGRTGCYELVSRPLLPVSIEELPPELRVLAELVRFTDVRFAFADTVPVGTLRPCAT
jgi:hypothetical protein